MSLVASTARARRVHDAEKRRLRHQRSAQKRSLLRAQLDAWARAATALRIVDDADAIWDAFVDADVRASRALLRRLAGATQDARRAAADNARLRGLLAEHQLSARALATALSTAFPAPQDDWELRVQRWRALARIHFRAWTPAQTAAAIDAVLRDRALDDTAGHAGGLSVFGWRDSVSRFGAGRALHFGFHKTFRGFDLAHFVDATERLFADTAMYTEIVHGGRARAYVDVVQRITPHVAIVMYHETYPETDFTVHSLSLNARIDRADGGPLLLFRPIDAPAIMRAFVGPTDVWMSHLHWTTYELLSSRGNATDTNADYRVSVCGELTGEDQSLVNYWRFRLLESLVRVECHAAKRGLLKCS